jgi:hypothetical protein
MSTMVVRRERADGTIAISTSPNNAGWPSWEHFRTWALAHFATHSSERVVLAPRASVAHIYCRETGALKQIVEFRP